MRWGICTGLDGRPILISREPSAAFACLLACLSTFCGLHQAPGTIVEKSANLYLVRQLLLAALLSCQYQRKLSEVKL